MSDSSQADHQDDEEREDHEGADSLEPETILEDAEELFEPDNPMVPPPQPDAPPPD
jgi:hypothetical protein